MATPSYQAPPPQAYAPAGGVKKERPAGVTILAVLQFLSGIVYLGMGAMFLTGGGYGGYIPGLTEVLAIIGGIFIVLGLVCFLIGWGLWTLKGWARIIAIILAILSLCNIPIGTIIGIIILWYLFKPEIKAAFE